MMDPCADMSAIHALKKSLRKSIQQRLRALSPAEIDHQSKAVTRNMISLERLHGAQAVSCYLSMPIAELKTDNLIRAIFERGIPLFAPYIPPPTPSTSRPTSSAVSTLQTPAHLPPPLSQDMSFLRLYSQSELDGLKRDKWGIPEIGTTGVRDGKKIEREDALRSSSPPLSIIFLPGLAFDHSFNRLGHGKGYYDRYIRRYKKMAVERGERAPLLVALTLREQLLPEGELVPTTPDDELMDVIIHPDGVLRRRDVAF